jgi:hypothetical protein
MALVGEQIPDYVQKQIEVIKMLFFQSKEKQS